MADDSTTKAETKAKEGEAARKAEMQKLRRWASVAAGVGLGLAVLVILWNILSSNEYAHAAKESGNQTYPTRTVIREQPRFGETLAPADTFSDAVRLHPGHCMIWDAGPIEVKRVNAGKNLVNDSAYFTSDHQTSLVSFRSTSGQPAVVGWTMYPLAHERCAPWRK